jgi:micrococcal nuclease
MTVSLNTIETSLFNKHVFAQGLHHATVEREDDAVITPENEEEVKSHMQAALDKTEILFTSEDAREAKHIKTVRFTKAVDSQRLLTSDGDIVYLEGLFIPENQDNDITTQKFIEEHYLDKDIDLYACKESKCKSADRYGHLRVHAVTQKDKVWLQAALLATGHAQMRTRSDWPALISRMQQIENEARLSEIGLWKITALSIMNALKISDEQRGFHIIEGIVRSVAMHKNIVYLNFGDDWRKDFTVVVPSTIRRAFAKNGIDIMGKGGETLRVRGWIDEYNGPFIEIDHIEQIEWVKTAN